MEEMAAVVRMEAACRFGGIFIKTEERITVLFYFPTFRRKTANRSVACMFDTVVFVFHIVVCIDHDAE